MAVNVSTILSVCLYCKTTDSEKEFHEVFDEVGVELQLPTLVAKFFKIKVTNEGKQLLCDDCVNRLIELVDLDEHAKGEKVVEKVTAADDNAGKVTNVIEIVDKDIKTEKSNENNENLFETVKIIENSSNNDQKIDILKVLEDIPYEHNLEIKIPKIAKEIQYNKNRNVETPTVCQDIQFIEDQDIETADSTSENHESQISIPVYDSSEENVSEEVDAINYNEKNVDNDDASQFSLNIKEDSLENEDQEIEIPNDFEEKPYVDQNSPVSVLLEEDCQEIEDQSYNNDNKTKIFIQHQEIFLPENIDSDQFENEDTKQNENSIEIELSEAIEDQYEIEEKYSIHLEAVTPKNDHQYDNEFFEVPTNDAKSSNDLNEAIGHLEAVTNKNYPQHDNEFFEERSYDAKSNDFYEDSEDDPIEELIESTDDHAEEDVNFKQFNCVTDNNVEDESNCFQDNNDNILNIDDSVDSIDNNVKEESNCFQDNNDNILNIDDSVDLIIEETQLNQKPNVVNEILKDNELTEEYLIEEISCSDGSDSVNLNEYFDSALVTKFENFKLPWSLQCKLCNKTYVSFQKLLQHSCIEDLFEKQEECCCILKDCEENVNSTQSLARHLIISHYNKVDSLPIYGRCPDCQKTFSNLIDFNKHSCCRNIKRKTGARNYCQTCEIDFQSLKRFVFHMQFHLTKHRPKICLLCGALFNNSNDFFEHTQYSHEPETALACIVCDRFFKEQEVYESHMELHEDSKYTFECSYCPKKYTTKKNLNVHMDVYHNHKFNTFHCEYCDKQLSTSVSYHNHMKCHILEEQVESYVCSNCGLISNNYDLMKDHVEMDTKSPCFSAELTQEVLRAGYSCENCSIDFKSPKHLHEHRLSSNHSNILFFCSMCRKSFKSLRHLRNHAVKHKEYEQWQYMFPIARYYMCNIGQCQEAYSLWTSLYYHKKRPHEDANSIDLTKDFICQFCQQKCTSKMSLAVHVARSHNNRNILCSVCKKAYKDAKSLQEHMDKFHTKKACSLCAKMFKSRRNLESHEHLVHKNEKRYFCGHCNKGYFYKSEMEAHEKNVHPEVSYKCEICNFVTNYPKSLEIHLDKHNNKFDFKCTVCSKSFGRKQQLNVHLKRHKNKKYVCCDFYESGCKLSFIDLNVLKKHILKHKDGPKKDTAKRKRSSPIPTQVEKIEDLASMILLEDNTNCKRRKKSTETAILDVNVVDSIELILENEIPKEDLKSENEFIIQYEDELINPSE